MQESKVLTTEQVLLLENLMYLTDESPLISANSLSQSESSATIRSWIQQIDMNKLKADKDYGSFITGDDWKAIINAVKKDPILMNMELVTTHIDNSEDGGGGISAVFANQETGEAVVAFRGTAGNEWKDNFIGGAATGEVDGVSTAHQKNALDWYQSLDLNDYDTITITGHSKGGNKAKYITLLDDSIDRCVSFDGQGFSDEFIEKYGDEIAKNQNKITNHNVDYDYVNLLLNDVGERIFYDGQGCGRNGDEGSFVENHCPNSFMDFQSDGTFTMEVVDGPGAEMEVLDGFINNYIRSLPEEEKLQAMSILGELAEMALGDGELSADNLINVLLDRDNEKQVAYLLAYAIEYKQENEEFMSSIESILREFGMENLANIINGVDAILDSKNFDFIFDLLTLGIPLTLAAIPTGIQKYILNLLNEKGIPISALDLCQLLSMLFYTNHYMEEIKIEDNGGDLITKSNAKHSGAGRNFINVDFCVQVQVLDNLSESFLNIGREINGLCVDVGRITVGLNYTQSMQTVTRQLSNIVSDMQKNIEHSNSMATKLQNITRIYRQSEQIVFNNCL